MDLIKKILKCLCEFFGKKKTPPQNTPENGQQLVRSDAVRLDGNSEQQKNETALDSEKGKDASNSAPKTFLEGSAHTNDSSEKTTNKEPEDSETDESATLGDKPDDSESERPQTGNNIDKPPTGGGRRSPGTTKGTKPETTTREPQEEKHELICYMTEGVWNIALKLFSHSRETEFLQNGTPLEFTRGPNNMRLLMKFSSEIVCPQKEIIQLFDRDNPLIFKFATDWKGSGKRVTRISPRGYYIIIVPTEWERSIENPVIDKGQCADETFSAHFVAPGETPDFDRWSDSSACISISLDGTIIHDNSGRGDLFVGDVPQLQSEEGWEHISWIRVGEEGGGKWGETFLANKKTLADILGNRTGWFYVRVYDKNCALIYSFDFRFFPTLQSIQINDSEYTKDMAIIPKESGHEKTKIRFIGIDGKNLHAQLRNKNIHAVVQDDGVIAVDRHPSNDWTEWTLDNAVDVDIALPRVWWRLDNGEWLDTPQTMTRKEFQSRQNNSEKVEICVPSHIKSVLAGINGDLSSNIPSYRFGEKEHCNIAIFCLQGFLLNAFSQPMNSLQIKCGEDIFSLIHVLDDRPPKPKPRPKIRPEIYDPSRIPIAQVKLSTGWRRGKGFSNEELRLGAGITANQARQASLRTDMRRKTAHCCNIKKLQQSLASKRR